MSKRGFVIGLFEAVFVLIAFAITAFIVLRLMGVV